MPKLTCLHKGTCVYVMYVLIGLRDKNLLSMSESDEDIEVLAGDPAGRP